MHIGFALGEAPSPPTIFLSSTYYDLLAVRQELEDFLADLGYVPILFEGAAALPGVAAPLSAIRHAAQADLCVLIIGERYGTVASPQQTSWTHEEFRTARDLGRPIFVFCLSSVLDKYEMYKSRPDPGFWREEERSLFRFIGEVSVLGSRFPFASLPELKSALRFQLASYFGYLVRRYSSLEEIAPTTSFAWRRIGYREARKGEFGKAVFCFRQAREIDPNDRFTLVGLISNLWRLARFEEAEEVVRDAMKRHPNYFKYRGWLCQILREMGRLEEALEEATALVERWPDDDRTWGTLSLIYERMGRGEEAVAAAKKAYEVAGKSRQRFYRLVDLDPSARREIEGTVPPLAEMEEREAPSEEFS